MVLNKCLPKVQSSMIFFLHYAFTSTVIYNPGQLRYLVLYSQSPYTTNLEWFSFYFKLCYTFKKHLKQLCNMSKKTISFLWWETCIAHKHFFSYREDPNPPHYSQSDAQGSEKTWVQRWTCFLLLPLLHRDVCMLTMPHWNRNLTAFFSF